MLEILQAIHMRTKGQRDDKGKKLVPEKTIVFSQFTGMMNIVEKFLDNEGIMFSRSELSLSWH